MIGETAKFESRIGKFRLSGTNAAKENKSGTKRIRGEIHPAEKKAV